MAEAKIVLVAGSRRRPAALRHFGLRNPFSEGNVWEAVDAYLATLMTSRLDEQTIMVAVDNPTIPRVAGW